MKTPPTLEAPAAWPVRFGLLLPRDIIVAPARAFTAIAVCPGWLPAYAVLLLLGLLTTALLGPAIAHVNGTVPLDGGSLSRTPAALTQANRALITTIGLQEAVIFPLVAIGLTATTLTVVARLKGKATRYVAFVALAANCLVPAALGDVAGALVARLHDPASYHDLRSLLLAVPDSLAVFAKPGNDREVQFLAQFDVFNIWSYVLLAYGIVALLRVRVTTALAIAFSLDFVLRWIF